MKIDKIMKKQILVIVIVGLLVFQPFTVYALTSDKAKQEWFDAKAVSRETQKAHREAQLEWAVDKNDENNQKVIDTGKEALQAALNEAEAWLIWRSAEIDENPEIPVELKDTIQQDIETNLDKIDDLRVEVSEVENRLQLAIVFLKMVGKYLELVTDVARNTGLIWVHIANTYADTIAEYEEQIRDAAETLSENEDLIEKLDEARAQLEEARMNIDEAESEYLDVLLPGTPLLKFSNGNQHLRIAKNHMITAHRSLRDAYLLLVGKDN